MAQLYDVKSAIHLEWLKDGPVEINDIDKLIYQGYTIYDANKYSANLLNHGLPFGRFKDVKQIKYRWCARWQNIDFVLLKFHERQK